MKENLEELLMERFREIATTTGNDVFIMTAPYLVEISEALDNGWLMIFQQIDGRLKFEIRKITVS